MRKFCAKRFVRNVLCESFSFGTTFWVGLALGWAGAGRAGGCWATLGWGWAGLGWGAELGAGAGWLAGWVRLGVGLRWAGWAALAGR